VTIVTAQGREEPMDRIETAENAGSTNPVEEKKPWVTPVATVEQVSELTRNTLGIGADAINCHS
jgi:hypothetical protein